MRRDTGLTCKAHDAIMIEVNKCKRLLQKLNFMDRTDADGAEGVVRELFGKAEGTTVNPPFYCD